MADQEIRDRAVDALTRLVRDVPDFPEPGVLFKDIAPLLADGPGFAAVVAALADLGRDDAGRPAVDKVVGMEARGFILAAPVAVALGVGFVPVRKAGKLPHDTHQVAYALEYGEAVLELHQDAFAPGSGCSSSTTCSPPAAPPGPPASWSGAAARSRWRSRCCWSWASCPGVSSSPTYR